jgi:hypothetical protein
MITETKLPAASNDTPRRTLTVRSRVRAGTATVTIRPAKTPNFRDRRLVVG